MTDDFDDAITSLIADGSVERMPNGNLRITKKGQRAAKDLLASSCEAWDVVAKVTGGGATKQ